MGSPLLTNAIIRDWYMLYATLKQDPSRWMFFTLSTCVFFALLAYYLSEGVEAHLELFF